MLPIAAEKQVAVTTLNALLRAEIAATHSYGQSRVRTGSLDATDLERLRTIERAHAHVVQELRAEIERLGGVPDETYGPWTTFIRASIDGPAQVFADAAILLSLKAGEERTLQTYHVVRETANAMVRKLISDARIPAQVQHISELEAILARL